MVIMAEYFITRYSAANRVLKNALLCALLAGPLCLTAKGQAVQAQSGSSGQGQAPQAQTPPAQNPPAQAPPAAPAKAQPQKQIKAHVIKADEKKKPNALDTTESAEPDKVLYTRAMADIKRGRYTEGRLTLQTLINTYPDSEYLAKAKLGVADSYYKEGGTSNLTQAIDEYKNFIIFFPFLDEAAYAQMQIGMGHYHMMEKSDRDTTQAIEAEQEFQAFLLKYPQSPLVPKAEQYLRDSQEVLADGQYRIARYYFVKLDYAASAARLVEITERYPLYSQSDESLWMLGAVYARAKQVSRNEDDKNHWSDLAARCYSRIVQNYPLSHLAPLAKSRLTTMGMPVPPPDPNALARMQQEQMFQKQHHQATAVRLPLAMLKSSPPVEMAAHSGPPNLNPPNDAVSAKDVLLQGAAGPTFDAQMRPSEDQAPATDSGPPVEAVSTSKSAYSGSGIGATIISSGSESSTPPAASQAPPSTSDATSSGNASGNASANAPATPPANAEPPANPPAASTTVDTATPPAVQPGTAAPDSATAVTGTSSQTPAPANGQAATPAPGQTPGQPAAQANGQPAKGEKADSSTESTSKKKKGIKKIIPW
jgi:outer membrane protein assembly factor BamD